MRIASEDFKPLDIKTEWKSVAQEIDLVFSLHCKQLFPPEFVKRVKCINIHPGLNPHNRGWFPQVFSILNKEPVGATIHEIDELIDHGPIIDQEPVELFSWDTSLTAYNRVLEAELRLLRKNLKKILSGDYSVRMPHIEGNVNSKKDFERLCKLDLKEKGTFADFLDRLRALSHGDYQNAYFIDSNGRKVFVKLVLQPDNAELGNVKR